MSRASEQPCPVQEDEARSDFNPQHRLWFHLHHTDRARLVEAEASVERLEEALRIIRDETLGRPGVAGLADIAGRALDGRT